MTAPEIIDLVHEILNTAPELAEIQNWNKANSLLTLAPVGGSIGVEKEVFNPYTRDYDEAVAHMNILVWVKNADAVAGEAAIRSLAQVVRSVLIENRTLGGMVDDSFIYDITYATADGGKSLLLHLAELNYQVTYYAERLSPAIEPTVATVNNEFE